MIRVLIGFLPWIVFFFLAGLNQHQMEIAVIASIITFLAVDLKALRRGFILSWGTMLFLIYMFIMVILFKHAWVITHPWLISNGVLAVVAFGSILVKKPFTIQYAKLSVDKSKWSSPVFYRINFILTLTWGVIFAFSILVHVVKLFYPHAAPWIYPTLSNGATILGIIITARLPDWYRNFVINRRK